MFLDACICIPLSCTTPNAYPAVASGQRESGFVSEEHCSPLLPGPSMMTSTENHSGLAMTWRQRQTDGSSSWAEVELVKAIADGLSACCDVSHPSQLLSQGGRSCGPVAHRCQHHVAVIMPVCDSGPSWASSFFGTSSGLVALPKALDDGVGHT